MPLLSDRACEHTRHDMICCMPARAHRALAKALARGDGGAAECICREQIEAARGRVLSAILTSSSMMNLAIGAEDPR